MLDRFEKLVFVLTLILATVAGASFISGAYADQAVQSTGAPTTFVGTTVTGTTITGTTGTFTTSATIGGATPTAITNIRVYAPSLTPAATTAAIQTSVQTFAVAGITTADKIFVNGPTPTSLCPMVAARASATDQIALNFTVLTAAICTPASGTYTIVAVRS
jgi:hypothetical protein